MTYIDSLLLLVLAISLYTDLKEQKIYNIVLVPGVLLALTYHLWSAGLGGGLFWAKGLILGMGLFFLPFMLGGLGAGDVKLLGLVGACKGAGFVFYAFLATALVGGLISLLVLTQGGLLFQTLKQLFASLKVFVVSRFTTWNFSTLEEQAAVSFPYGLAIVCGTILTYWVI